MSSSSSSNSRVLKRGLSLLISEGEAENKPSVEPIPRSNKWSSNSEFDRASLQLKVEKATVRLDSEVADRALRYSTFGKHKRFNPDWDLTKLRPSHLIHTVLIEITVAGVL